MARRIASIAVLLCAVQATLCQTFDCATRSGQLAFLQNGAESDPACYNPIIDLIVSGRNPTPAQTEDVCRESCAGVMLAFLRSTRDCREDEGVQRSAHYVENELCAYKDGEGKPETSCALQSESDIRVLLACFRWWYSGGGSECPALFPGVPVAAPSCADALRTAVDEYGCCLQNLFGTEESIETVTRYIVQMIPPGTDVPSGFEIDVTDPNLYNACGVRLPEMCESQSDTVTSAAAAPGLALPPVVALLFGTLLAKLFS